MVGLRKWVFNILEIYGGAAYTAIGMYSVTQMIHFSMGKVILYYFCFTIIKMVYIKTASTDFKMVYIIIFEVKASSWHLSCPWTILKKKNIPYSIHFSLKIKIKRREKTFLSHSCLNVLQLMVNFKLLLTAKIKLCMYVCVIYPRPYLSFVVGLFNLAFCHFYNFNSVSFCFHASSHSVPHIHLIQKSPSPGPSVMQWEKISFLWVNIVISTRATTDSADLSTAQARAPTPLMTSSKCFNS